MTQVPPAAAPMGIPPAPSRTSGLATAALVCSLIFCCPGLGLIGLLLGLAALPDTRRPGVGGRGLAVAGILIGLLVTIGQVAISYATYRLAPVVIQKVDEAINAVVEDYNEGDDQAVYDRAADAMHTEVTYEEFHDTLERARKQWGKAERMGLWKMITSGGFWAQSVNGRTTIELPMRFEKVGIRTVRVVYQQEQDRLKLVRIEFVGLESGSSEAIE